MGKARIDLFFDVISPYSWISFEALCRYRSLWAIDLRLRPFFLGGVMSAAGNQAPAMVPKKGVYMGKDIERQRDYWNIPLGHLKDFGDSILTKGSLTAQRYLMSLNRHAPEKLEDAARELWMRRWSRDEDIHLVDHFLEVSRKIGLSKVVGDTVVAEIELKEVKEALKNNTKEAIEHGAFGAPWIHVYKDGKVEPFFGSDRFPVIAEMIGERFPGAAKELSKL